MAVPGAQASIAAAGPGSRLAAAVARLTGLRRLLAAFGAGAVAALSLPPAGLWPMLIVGIAVLLWLLDGAARRHSGALDRFVPGFVIGWSFGFGYFATSLYWVGFAFFVDAERFAALMPLAVAALPAGLALFWGLAAAAALALWQPTGIGRAAILAVAVSAGEWLRGNVFTGFPWNAPGYASGALDGLAQAASVVGVYGLTLAVVLWAGLAVVVLTESLDRRSLVAAGVVLMLAPIAWAGGQWRLAHAGSAVFEGIGLRIVQANVAQADKWRPERRDEIVATYLDLSIADGLDGRTHVIWPESALPVIIEDAAQMRDRLLQHLPGQTLILGALRADQGSSVAGGMLVHNSLLALSDAAVAAYDKWRLVPFGEYLPLAGWLEPLGLRRLVPLPLGFSAGSGPKTMAIQGLPPFAPLICYEAIFPRSVVAPGARPDWLLNLTNDGWFGRTAGPYQHLEQARFRAIEQGLALVRAANTGISAVIDPYGRILHRLELGDSGVIDAPLPRPLPPTHYSRWRDGVFLAVLAMAGLFGWMTQTRYFRLSAR